MDTWRKFSKRDSKRKGPEVQTQVEQMLCMRILITFYFFPKTEILGVLFK